MFRAGVHMILRGFNGSVVVSATFVTPRAFCPVVPCPRGKKEARREKIARGFGSRRRSAALAPDVAVGC